MNETTTEEVELAVEGDGTALKLCQGTTTFALTNVEIKPREGSEKATVQYVPDPDNADNTIFWIRGIEGKGVGELPEGTVTLILTYTGE